MPPESKGNLPKGGGGNDRRSDASSQQQFQNIYSNSGGGKAHLSKSKKKISKKRKIINTFIIIFSVLFAAAGGGLLYMYSMVSSTYHPRSGNIDINYSALESVNGGTVQQSGDTTDTLMQDKSVLNILLMGEDNDGNSDSMMLVSIDQTHQKLKITSFMRDLKLWIPEVNSYHKLNYAYAAGGEELAIQTLERNFGVYIDKYVKVNFDSFAEIIDILGGVTVTVSDEEAAFIDMGSGFPNALKKGGTYTLNGGQALCHSRDRAIGDDQARTRRQRDVMLSLINKFKSTKDVGTIVQLMRQVLPAVETDISFDQMSGLAWNSLKYMNYPMTEFRLPTDDNFTNVDDAYLGAILDIDDMEQARADLRQFIYEDGSASSGSSSAKRG